MLLLTIHFWTLVGELTSLKRYPEVTVYRRLLKEVRPFRVHLFGGTLLSFLFIPATMLLPLPLKIEVDSVLGSHPLPGFVRALVPRGALESRTSLLGVPAVLFVMFALFNQLQSLASDLL
jgi:ATP-binding cassette, subfamily B, bacterial